MLIILYYIIFFFLNDYNILLLLSKCFKMNAEVFFFSTNFAGFLLL